MSRCLYVYRIMYICVALKTIPECHFIKLSQLISIVYYISLIHGLESFVMYLRNCCHIIFFQFFERKIAVLVSLAPINVEQEIKCVNFCCAACF